MNKIKMTNAYARRLKICHFAWSFLLGSIGVAAQSIPSTPNPSTSPSPGLPVIGPSGPKPSGPLPWQVPGSNRFYTNSNEMQAFLEKSEKPNSRAEEFRRDMEKSRLTLEQEKASKKISNDDYLRALADYHKSMSLYRDLKK